MLNYFTFWCYFNNQIAEGDNNPIIYYTTLYTDLQVLMTNFLDFYFYLIFSVKITVTTFCRRSGVRYIYVVLPDV